MQRNKKLKANSILEGERKFLYKWNLLFPLDKIWREKKGLPLFCEEHLDQSQYNILLSLLEEKIYLELQKNNGSGSMTDEEEELFDNLEI